MDLSNTHCQMKCTSVRDVGTVPDWNQEGLNISQLRQAPTAKTLNDTNSNTSPTILLL